MIYSVSGDCVKKNIIIVGYLSLIAIGGAVVISTYTFSSAFSANHHGTEYNKQKQEEEELRQFAEKANVCQITDLYTLRLEGSFVIRTENEIYSNISWVIAPGAAVSEADEHTNQINADGVLKFDLCNRAPSVYSIFLTKYVAGMYRRVSNIVTVDIKGNIDGANDFLEINRPEFLSLLQSESIYSADKIYNINLSEDFAFQKNNDGVFDTYTSLEVKRNDTKFKEIKPAPLNTKLDFFTEAGDYKVYLKTTFDGNSYVSSNVVMFTLEDVNGALAYKAADFRDPPEYQPIEKDNALDEGNAASLDSLFSLELLDNYQIKRSETTAPAHSLTWVISKNGHIILQRNADDETVLTIISGGFGLGADDKADYEVYLKAFYDDRYERVSNILDFEVDKALCS